MLITFNFSYLENFFIVFYLSFNFILAPGASAHETTRLHRVHNPSPAEPNQGQPYVDVDTQDPWQPIQPTPPDPGNPPLTPANIRDPNLLRATLQGRALTSTLGWYRLQEDWTQLTVKALRDLTTPGNSLHEAIVV